MRIEQLRRPTTSLLILVFTISLMGCAGMGGQMATAPGPDTKHHVFWAYVGTNAGPAISLFKLDTDTGKLTSEGTAAEVSNPGFLAIAPDHKHLYSGARKDGPTTAGGQPATKESSIAAFSIDAKTGKLTKLNQEGSGGEDATFVGVDPSGRNVLAAHYSVAIVSVLPIASDGKVLPPTTMLKQSGSSINPARQTHAYAHSINTDPAGKIAIVCDLGADKLFVYRFDSAAGKLTPADPPTVSVTPGSGPRHLTFHPNGKFFYVVNEMGGTVIAYSYDAHSAGIKELQTVSTLPSDFKGNNTSAEVQIDPTGRFLYASNRGDSNFLTIFTIDQVTGTLTLVGHQPSMGRIPRNFRIDPTGKYMIVANQDSNNVVLFSIDPSGGKLTQASKPLEAHTPTCVKFLPVD